MPGITGGGFGTFGFGGVYAGKVHHYISLGTSLEVDASSHITTATAIGAFSHQYNLVAQAVLHNQTVSNADVIMLIKLVLQNSSVGLTSEQANMLLSMTLNKPSDSTLKLLSNIVQLNQLSTLYTDSSKHELYSKEAKAIEWDSKGIQVGSFLPTALRGGEITAAPNDDSGSFLFSGIETDQYKSSSVDEEGFYRYN